MTNKENFLALVSEDNSKTIERNKERIRNRAMLRESQQIALKILLKLDDLGWTQKGLAEKMNVSPQQISKIVSGKENLTIETQIKLQNILDIPILASYYEKETEKLEGMTLSFEERIDKIVAQAEFVNNHYHNKSENFQKIYDYPLSIAS